MERLNNPSHWFVRVLVISDTVPDDKEWGFLRTRNQKNQTEDGEKSLHGVEFTPVGSGVQTPLETSSCYLVGLGIRKISSEVGISTGSVSRVLNTC